MLAVALSLASSAVAAPVRAGAAANTQYVKLNFGPATFAPTDELSLQTRGYNGQVPAGADASHAARPDTHCGDREPAGDVKLR